jgi:hypothetical protein
LISQYAAFIDSIVANGNIAMPINTTFRNYLPEAVLDEPNGSLPYNENVVWPKASTVVPAMWDGDRPYNDPYNIGRNWYSVLLVDPVHYDTTGYHLLRTFDIDCAGHRILGLAPPRVPRIENPALNQVPPLQRAMVTFTGGGTLSKSATVYWAMQRGQSFVGTGRLLPMGGYVPNKMQIVLTAAAPASGNNAGAFNNGNTSPTLLHDGVKNGYIQTSSLVYAEAAKFTGFAPGQAVRIDLLSCRSAAGATNRWAQFSLDGGLTYTDVNGAYSSGAVPVVTTLTGVASALGEISLGWRCRAGSGFAYLNGVIVSPL